MKTVKTRQIVAFLLFQLSVLCQTTPFGEITKIPNTQQNKVWATILSYRTNLLFAAYSDGWDSLSYSNGEFVKTTELKPPVNSILSFSGTFKNSPFLIYNYKTIIFSPSPNQWVTLTNPEMIIDFETEEDKVVFLSVNEIDKTFTVITSTDLKFFTRFKTPFKTLNFNQDYGLDENKLFRVGDKYYLSFLKEESRVLYETLDFITYEKVEGTAINIWDAFEINNQILYIDSPNSRQTFLTDKTFKTSTPLGIQSDNYSFKFFNGIAFSTSRYAKKINYSLDGINWSSFPVKSVYNHKEINTLCFFKNHLIFVGDGDYIYKIGPIFSPEPLQVNSELVHSIKITGNIGQQVEILASDELNGEYKPLTYFTLPSTEFIYNDNRTNKAKQYYKVK